LQIKQYKLNIHLRQQLKNLSLLS